MPIHKFILQFQLCKRLQFVLRMAEAILAVNLEIASQYAVIFDSDR
mgnify:CR=1 FL=1